MGRTTSQRQILIVEDDSTIRSVLADLFAFEGYGVATAANGREALAIVERSTIDVLLTDLAMPVMDGWVLGRMLRARGSRIPIIVMTATARDLAEEARELDAAAYLVKPFDLGTVVAVVAQTIR